MEQTTTGTSPPVFDFSTIDDVPTGTLRIKDPQGAPTPMVITLMGPEHPDRKRRLFGRQRRLRQALSKNGRLPVADPEDDDADELDELVASTIGWSGAAVPYSEAACRALYSDPKRQWLRVQVRAGLDDREAFTRRSAAS